MGREPSSASTNDPDVYHYSTAPNNSTAHPMHSNIFWLRFSSFLLTVLLFSVAVLLFLDGAYPFLVAVALFLVAVLQLLLTDIHFLQWRFSSFAGSPLFEGNSSHFDGDSYDLEG